MTLDVNQVEKIDQLAQNVHQQIFGNIFYYTELEKALEKHGIAVRWIDSDHINGYLRYDNNAKCPVIAVTANNILSTWLQRRFVMAYELGCLIVKYHWQIDNPVYNQELNLISAEFLDIYAPKFTEHKTNETEYFNEFAYSFLIPNDKLEPIVDLAVKEDMSGERIINEVAARFETSTATSQAKLLSYLKNIYYVMHPELA